MKTKMIVLNCFILCTGSLFAQTIEKKAKEKNRVTVNIVKEIDGKKTVIDTTFYTSDDSSYKEFFREHDIKMDVHEVKGKNGKTIKKEVVMHFDDEKENSERKMMFSSPVGPVPPMPPMPPMPPSPPRPENEENSFSFNWTDEDGTEHNDEMKKVIKMKRKGQDESSMELQEIEKWMDDGKSGRKSKRNKNAKKRIVIIEEY